MICASMLLIIMLFYDMRHAAMLLLRYYTPLYARCYYAMPSLRYCRY